MTGRGRISIVQKALGNSSMHDPDIERIRHDPGVFLQTDRSGKGYVCPVCGSGTGKKGTGMTSRDGVHFTCWAKGCFRNADIFDIVGECFHLADFPAQLAMARRLYGLNTMVFSTYAETQDYTAYFREAEAAYQKAGQAQAYMAARGIGPALAEHFHIGFDPEWRSPKALREGKNPPSSARLILPTGPSSYLARAIDPDIDPRYRVFKEGPAQLFHAEALCKEGEVYVVEGEIDALSVMEAGGEAVALGSLANAGRLVNLCGMEKPACSLLIALDNDPPGRKMQRELKRGLLEIGVSAREKDICGTYKDPNDRLVRDREGFILAVHAEEREYAEKKRYFENADSANLRFFLEERPEANRGISTGFPALDEALGGGLFEGLYTLGALSSLGKTTFALQMAAQIAQQGQDILFFSLEMSRRELMAKTLSRLTHAAGQGMSAREILQGGENRPALREAIAAYETYARHMFTMEGQGDLGAKRIREAAEKHIAFCGKPPVIVVDYLQILAPRDPRYTDKQNMDKSVLELKRLSRDYALPVLAISSFNRESYTTAAHMASFKESGALEYASDVLFALQPRGMESIPRDEAMRRVDALKQSDPRAMELKILKNRSGRTGAALPLLYHAAKNLFEEKEEKRQAQRKI